MDDNILLVLGVIEGRHFPKRPHHKLLVEAKFDNEILNADVIKHTDNPQFNTELAWEIDKKTLHQHRLQRTPVKIQVYALEASNMKKELIGYCVLDLRSAQQHNEKLGKKKSTWVALLSSKYQSTKPEIHMVLSIEKDDIKNLEGKNNDGGKNVEDGGSAMSSPPQQDHSVVLDEGNGYYIIGSKTSESQVFVLSVAVGEAKNLVQLLPSDKNLNPANGYFFYYNLFNNDVTNETFHDLMSPSFPTERATVRISTTADKLIAYLREKRILEIFLCCGDTSMGRASVSLQPLLSDPCLSSPISTEGMFQLMTSDGKTTQATIGVSVVLKRETNNVVPVEVSPVLAASTQSPVLSGAARQHSVVGLPRKTLPPTFSTPPLKMQTSAVQVKEVDVTHHYVFSVDLRSISNETSEFPLTIICRYTYPFFGSSSPIMTHPPVLVQRGSEVLIPNSFCKFEFASTAQLLQTTFARVPLIVEVWNKDPNTKDFLIGISKLQLSDIYETNTSVGDGPLIRNQRVDLITTNSPPQRIGTIHVVFGLEDRGKVVDKIHPPVPQPIDSSLSEPTISTKPDVPRETQEYQVAMALEIWRHQQEELFHNQLSTKENARMKVLAEEWKQRDLERESMLSKKFEEYKELEAKLKKSLSEVEQHQKELNNRDVQLSSKERVLNENYNAKLNDMREASRRLKEEYDHQLHLEKMKHKDMEERLKQAEKRAHETEAKLKERENDVYHLKESLLNKPDVKIHSDMHLLMLEKSELERRLEAVQKSKVHYKQQWGRALRELARLKMCEQEAAKMRLKKQQQELDHMKLRYIAAEEKQVMTSEKDELKNVKEELTKKIEELQNVQSNVPLLAHTNNKNKVADEVNKTRIAKLVEERDTLLQTGVYSLNDRVINDLDREIKLLLSNLTL